ncbi:hypothetical protein N7519_007744 [Penicillium mononematosum]|uniref:uncharacterized protein n=1 Tax=Penicillium mononematosum TaxID=268346 RepID=UPI002547EEDE|nr:uncharacterized protein N7519_007744 [Penicillium mononematosum]KAJ6186443.1 hypothetical protein N7519_007744 [Penicillium mononematosum]
MDFSRPYGGVSRARRTFGHTAKVFKHFLKAVQKFPEYLFGLARGTRELEEAIPDPKAPEEFEKNLDLITKRSGLDQWYKPGNSLLKSVAKEAARLRNDPNNHLNSPEQIGALINVALYKLVLYCDDSQSMTGPSAVQGKTRMQAQSDLVNKIAEIATRALPEDMRRVHLQFINRTQQLDDIKASELPGKMNFTPYGATQLGTSLKNRILSPLVYNVLNEEKPLLRPYLILTITDGSPNQEDHHTFRTAIQEAKNHVTNKGYDEAEHLDAQFNALRGSDAELENWLLDKLKGPIKFRDDSKKDK